LKPNSSAIVSAKVGKAAVEKDPIASNDRGGMGAPVLSVVEFKPGDIVGELEGSCAIADEVVRGKRGRKRACTVAHKRQDFVGRSRGISIFHFAFLGAKINQPWRRIYAPPLARSSNINRYI
jgi:hypothetical protein